MVMNIFFLFFACIVLFMVEVRIQLKDYLKEYLIGKYCNGVESAIRVPPHTVLYEKMYHLVSRRPLSAGMDTGNTLFELRFRNSCKDPRVYNWFSMRHQKKIEQTVNLQMRSEFHYFVDNLHHRHGVAYIDAVVEFMKQYGITTLSEEALIKDYQRYRDRLHPHARRQYTKSDKKL